MTPHSRPSGAKAADTPLELELESFYSITTFIGDISPPPQIRQVAQLTEHYMQPARIKPHAKEHTNNPVQRPNLRGHAITKIYLDC